MSAAPPTRPAVLGRRSALLELSALAALAACGSTGPGKQGDGGSELALQSRIVAPCCWNQTLENHASPLADELRAEIHRRLRAGEPASAIEDDFAARYGERVRAMPRTLEPRPWLAGFVLAAMLSALVGVLRWARGRVRASASSTLPVSAGPDAYDDRLRDELARLD